MFEENDKPHETKHDTIESFSTSSNNMKTMNESANIESASNAHEVARDENKALNVASEDWQSLQKGYSTVKTELPSYPISTQNIMPDDVRETIASMLVKLPDGMWSCVQCGKTSKLRKDVGRHVETHIQGVSYPCNLCGKTYRSVNSLNC